MKTKTKKVTGLNSQQVLYLQGLLQGVKEGKPQQNIPFRMGLTEKYAGIKFDIEVYPNCNGFIAWRVINFLGAGLWQTWEDEEEIFNTFKGLSLL